MFTPIAFFGDIKDNLFITSGIGDITIRKMNTDLFPKINLNHGAVARTVCVDNENNFYIGGGRINNVTNRMYDINGNLIRNYDAGGLCRSMDIDPVTKEVYIAGDRNDNIDSIFTSIRKFDSNGNQLWTLDTNSSILSIYYKDGFVYAGGFRSGTIPSTLKINATNGNVVWDANHGATVRGITADDEGNVYTVGNRVGDITTRKYDSDGNLLWSVDHGAQVNAVFIDNLNKRLYTAGLPVSNATVRIYSLNGDLLDSIETGVNENSIVSDSKYIYVGGLIDSSGFELRKYDLDGNFEKGFKHGLVILGMAYKKRN